MIDSVCIQAKSQMTPSAAGSAENLKATYVLERGMVMRATALKPQLE